jgi:hypothetical protein
MKDTSTMVTPQVDKVAQSRVKARCFYHVRG